MGYITRQVTMEELLESYARQRCTRQYVIFIQDTKRYEEALRQLHLLGGWGMSTDHFLAVEFDTRQDVAALLEEFFKRRIWEYTLLKDGQILRGLPPE